MKNTTTWALFCRGAFALSSGRMSSTLAPVVPMKLAMTAPSAMTIVLTIGVPASEPCTYMPPLMMNSEPSRMMNETYSIALCCRACVPSCPKPNSRYSAVGIASRAAMIALLRLCSHQCGVASGRIAMHSKMAANGNTAIYGIRRPSG